jgi:hypothetical protein
MRYRIQNFKCIKGRNVYISNFFFNITINQLILDLSITVKYENLTNLFLYFVV